MSKKPLTRVTGAKPADATESHQSIEDQTRAFLARGGNIESVTTGVTGVQSLAGSKQIIISR
jgi:hypothetical protein